MARVFPTAPQADFVVDPRAQRVGMIYGYQRGDETVSALIRAVPETSQVVTYTVTYGADGDDFGLTLDGATFPAEALTDSDISAAALETVILTAIGVGALNVTVSVATNVVTVTYLDALTHTAASFEPDATTGVVGGSPAVSYARLQFGDGATVDPGAGLSVTGPGLLPVAGAASAASVLRAVLGFNYGDSNTRYVLEQQGFDPDYLAPGPTYAGIQRGRVIVPWIGTLPTSAADPVFWINDPADPAHLNKFRIDANGGEAVAVNAKVEGVIPDQSGVKVAFDLV